MLIALSWGAAITLLITLLAMQSRAVELQRNYDVVAERLTELGEDIPEPVQDGDIIDRPNDQPPIITLSDEDGFRFESGSASITSSFRESLTADVARQLVELGSLYDADVIEVIGHTDEEPYGSRPSNLDITLIGHINGESNPLRVSDNTGLGMARAAAVVNVLRATPGLEGFEIVALSAGQTQMTNGRIPTQQSGLADRTRRRIEIRLRRAR